MRGMPIFFNRSGRVTDKGNIRVVQVEPSSNATFFRLPTSLRVILIIGVLAFLGFTGLGIALFFSHERIDPIILMFSTAVCGFFGVVTLQALRRSRDQVAVDDNGMWYLPRVVAPTFIGWNEIGEVQGREIMKRLVITDTTGTRRIRVEYQLDDFDRLRELILARTAARRMQLPNANVFHRNYLNRRFLAASLVLVIGLAYFWARQGPGASLVLLAFALIIFAVFAQEPSKLEISDRSFVIHCLLSSRPVAFDEIEGIELANLRGAEGGVSAAVIVDRKLGKPLRLMGFKGGSISLYDSMRRAWQDAGGGAADGGAMRRAGTSRPQTTEQTAAPLDGVTFPVSFSAPARPVLQILLVMVVNAAIVGVRIFQIRSIPEASLAQPIFLSVILGACVVFLMARIPLSATVLRDAVDVQYTLWLRHVPYTVIANISLTSGRDLGGRRTERVRVDLRNFVTFSVMNVRKGSLTLYDTLRAGWHPDAAAASNRVVPDTVEPLTQLSIPYVPPWRRDPNLRRFPPRLPPAVIALAFALALVAPRGIWHDLRGMSESPPNTKALAMFPKVATGWAGAPVPIFPGETLGGRWNVDYKTGAFTHSQTDIYIGDAIPINVTRVFLNRETYGAFGAGTSISYDTHTVGDGIRFTYMYVMTPDGENFHFTRTSPGTGWADAIYRADTIRGGGVNPFAGATISWNGNGWTLRMSDATLMKFPAVHGQASEGQEGLQSVEDAKGNLLRIDRDRWGNILKITSPHGAYVTFRHDRYNRIVSATDYLGKTILYDYDPNEENQHLIRVDNPTDGITHYNYSQSGNLLRIVKPDGTIWLKADYDDRGRVAEMVFDDRHSCRYEYQTNAQGMIVGVDVIPSNGSPSRISVAGATGG
jgi:YD repeat-containing protein